MLGSSLACVGVLGASFSTNLQVLLVSYSLVTGVGFGLMVIPGVVACQDHFTRRRSLAQALAVCGTGMGTLVLPPFVETLITCYGWRWTLRALSGVCLGSVLCGAAMFSPRNKRNTSEDNEEVTDTDISQESPTGWRWLLSLVVGPGLASSKFLPMFLIVMVGDFLATMSLYIPYTHLPDLAMARGVSSQDAAFLISAAGIGSMAGRVMAGALCDNGRLHPMTLTLLATTLAAISAFLLHR